MIINKIMDCFPLLIFIEYKKLGIWEKSKLCVDIGFETEIYGKSIKVNNIEYASLYVYYMKFMKNINNIISILY